MIHNVACADLTIEDVRETTMWYWSQSDKNPQEENQNGSCYRMIQQTDGTVMFYGMTLPTYTFMLKERVDQIGRCLENPVLEWLQFVFPSLLLKHTIWGIFVLFSVCDEAKLRLLFAE